MCHDQANESEKVSTLGEDFMRVWQSLNQPAATPMAWARLDKKNEEEWVAGYPPQILMPDEPHLVV